MIDTSKILTGLTVNGVAMELANPADYIIKVAELPGVTIKLLNDQGVEIASQETPATTGGIVSFTAPEAGEYRIQAFSGSTLLWSKLSIIIDTIGEYIIKSGKALSDYTEAEIHTACQGGYAQHMWAEGDMRTIVQTGVWNNKKVFIEQFVENEDGTTSIDWRSAARLDTKAINAQRYIVTSTTATSWSSTYSSNGGMKYCDLRKEFMQQGEEIYSQITGILPNDYSGTLTTGVKLSDLVYTTKVGGQNIQCKVYTYDKATDTFTETTTVAMSTSTFQSSAPFMKGYFKNVGTIDETTFNAGNYYIYGSNVYTRATTYASGTTYYGLYETLQDEGSYLSALPASTRQYMQKRKTKASAGGTQTTSVTEMNDYINLPCIEEIFGVNRSTTLKSGTAATNANAYNLVGEGSKLKVYDDWSFLCMGQEYWTRSTYSNSGNSFCYVATYGILNNGYVNFTYGVRAGFRTN